LSEYESLAKSVLRSSLHVKPGENVIVESWNHGVPIAAEFVYQIRAMGARSLFLLEDEETFWRSAATLPPSKQGKIGKHEWAALKEADAYVFITGPADIRKIREVGIDKYNAMTDYNDEWYKRAERYKIRGVRVGLGYVTPERAAAYGLDLEAWRRMMLDASAIDAADLRRAGRTAQRLLSGKGHVEITAPNGTRFACDLAGRKARLDDGVITPQLVEEGENMASVPAGELYVAPDEGSGEGTIRFDRPNAYTGRWMRGLTFGFDGGRAKWSAEENGELVQRQWAKGTEGRDQLGGLQIGLNPRVRTGFLQDYLAAGNVYVTIGDNDEFGGTNTSSFGLAGTLTGATVTIDGTAVVRNGRIVSPA